MSKTQTTTFAPNITEASNTLVMRFRNEAANSLDRLTEIMLTIGDKWCKKYNDPMSYDLRKWSLEVISMPVNGDLDEDIFRNNVKSYLNKLQTILVDSIEKKLVLRDPVLVVESGWTCEKLLIEQCEASINGNPVTVVTHEFAKEMIAWASSISLDHDPVSLDRRVSPVRVGNETQIVKLTEDTTHDKEMESCLRAFLTTYKTKVQMKIMMIQLVQAINNMEEESEELQCWMELMEERSREKIMEAEQRAEESKIKIERRIETMENRNREELAGLQVQAEELNQKMEQSEQEALRLKIESINQANEIRNLRVQYAMRMQELEALRNSGRGSRCIIL